MKVLIVGSWFSTTYEAPLFNALANFAEVYSFKWCEYFSFKAGSNRLNSNQGFINSIWNRFQNKFIFGPALYRINRDLLKEVENISPDFIFIYRGTHIWPSTVKRLQKKTIIISYNNDDPFSTHLPKYVYRHFLPSLKYSDWILAYRDKNIKDYENLGFKNCSIFRSNYLKEVHFPIQGISKKYDVIFIGHFENDGRDEVILHLLKKKNLKIGLWGMNWEKSQRYQEISQLLGNNINPIFGDEYNKTINQAKVALVFFSKINNDGYTRRCFEIPATKTLMLCEYSPLIETLFTRDEEAVYFESFEELYSKVDYYLKNENERVQITEKSYQRLLKDGHDITDRAKELISLYKIIKERK